MTEIPKTFFIIPAIGIIIIFALLFMPSNAEDIYFVNSGGGSSSGVTSLTSNNSAIVLNASSGNILISPKWELLCETTLVNSSDRFSCGDFTPRNNLYVTTVILNNNSMTLELIFNNDTGNNYSWRRSANGGADSTATSDTNCFLITFITNGGGYIVFEVLNIENKRKILVMQEASDLATGATSAPSKIEETCKWNNTTDQITNIGFNIAGLQDYLAGSKITVWGYD